MAIKSFIHKGLAELWETGRTSTIDKRIQKRVLARLDALDQTERLSDLAPLPGFDFHTLKGFKPDRHTVHVNGPWCITFEFDAGDVFRVDFEQYH
jgi:proteic killer suppression protein